MRLQIIGFEVPLNGIASLPNFVKIYQTVQKLVEEDRQTDVMISIFSFLESRLKSEQKVVRQSQGKRRRRRYETNRLIKIDL
jgi:hypothetical protein